MVTVFQPAFLAPRYWPIWLAVFVLWLVVRLPFSWQLGFGKGLGAVLYLLMGRRRHIARVNLRLCLRELDERARRRILFQHFQSLGIALVETGMSWWASDRKLRSLAKVSGLEHLQKALQKGKGVLLLGAHFTTMEMGMRLLALFHPFDVLYRPSPNPLLAHIILRSRLRNAEPLGIHFLNWQDVRGMISALRHNRAVWYAPDQNYGRHSVFVHFFHELIATITTPSRFSRLSGAAVVPFFHHRLPGTGGYEILLLPALGDFPSGDDARDAERINRLIEEQIWRYPEQYLWIHRRFKSRPAGGEDIYRTS